jgi:cell division septum initiation protein DivIVA
MDAAVRHQQENAGHIGSCLLELGAIDEGILLYYASKQLRVPSADRDVFTSVRDDALRLWGRERARTHSAVPLSIVDGSLRLAVVTPLDAAVVDAFEAEHNIGIEQLVALELRVQQAMYFFYDLPLNARFAALVERYPFAMRRHETGAQAAVDGSEPARPVSGQGDVTGLAWTMPQWSAFVATSTDRDAMLLATLGFVGKFFERRMLLVAGKDSIRGFALQMEGEPKRPVARFEYEFEEGSALARLAEGESYVLGSPADADLTALYEHLGATAPRDVLVMPIKVGQRAALLLLGDAGSLAVNPRVLPIASLVVNRLGAGLERLIRELKLRRTSSLPSVSAEAPEHLSSSGSATSPVLRERATQEAQRLLDQSDIRADNARRGVRRFVTSEWTVVADQANSFELPEVEVPLELADAQGLNTEQLHATGNFESPLAQASKLASAARRDQETRDADVAQETTTRQSTRYASGSHTAPLRSHGEGQLTDAMEAVGRPITSDYEAVDSEPKTASISRAADTGSTSAASGATRDLPSVDRRTLPQPADREARVRFRRKAEDSGSIPVVSGTGSHRRAVELDLSMPGVLQNAEVVRALSSDEKQCSAAVLAASNEQLIAWLVNPIDPHYQFAFVELLSRGPSTFDALMEAFPGPLRVERVTDTKNSRRTPIEEHGPILWLCALQMLSVRQRLRKHLDSPEDDTRYYATRLLLQSADPTISDLMVRRAIDPDVQIRELALKHLRTFLPLSDGDTIRETVRSHLTDSEVWRAEAAIHATVELRDFDAIPMLIGLLDHDSAHTRQRSASALSRLTFQDFGATQALWQRWHATEGARGRNEWLVDAMVSKDWKVRDNASRELRAMKRLVVNYHPDLNRQAWEAAQRAVHRYLYGRDGGPVARD